MECNQRKARQRLERDEPGKQGARKVAPGAWAYSLSLHASSYYNDFIMTQALEQKIKALVQKTVKETLRAEFAHLRADALPLVAKEEMTDIMKRYKKPTRQAVRIIRTHP